jgi:hypothetical protein
LNRLQKALFFSLIWLIPTLGLAHGNHDHAHNHSQIEADRPMTVRLEVSPDLLSGYNLTIHTEHFSWAPQRASTKHFTGEGHAHLYINDVKFGRLYGAHHHIPSSALQAGENVITVTLNANTHEDYTIGGELVAASTTIMAEAAHNHDEQGHSKDSHDSTHGHSHDHGDSHNQHHGANTVSVGEIELTLEPLLVADGTLKLALTVTDHAHHDHDHVHDKDIAVTLPDGSSVDAHMRSNMALIALGTVQAGNYQLTGTLGHDTLNASFTVMQAEGDLGTDITLVLTPSPDHHTNVVEAFVYAFENGEAIHRQVVLAQGSQTATFDLSHTHFSDSYITDDFEPMAEQATVTFPTAGEWLVSLTIMGGLPETATFAVVVE